MNQKKSKESQLFSYGALRALSYDLLLLCVAWPAAFFATGIFCQLRGGYRVDWAVERAVFGGTVLVVCVLAFWLHRRLEHIIPQGEWGEGEKTLQKVSKELAHLWVCGAFALIWEWLWPAQEPRSVGSSMLGTMLVMSGLLFFKMYRQLQKCLPKTPSHL